MTTRLERGEHGSATSWRLGCRCDHCRRALLRAAKVWWATAQLRRGADPATRVPARRLVEHLDRLADSGWTAREVARVAAVAPSTLSRARHRGVKVSRLVERAVLAIEL